MKPSDPEANTRPSKSPNGSPETDWIDELLQKFASEVYAAAQKHSGFEITEAKAIITARIAAAKVEAEQAKLYSFQTRLIAVSMAKNTDKALEILYDLISAELKPEEGG